MAAGAERGVYLLLAAQHAQQGLPELLQSLLQGPALLAAAAVQPLVLLVISARGARRRGTLATAGAGHQVDDARVVEGAPCVVVHFLGGTSDVEDVLLAQVDVFIEEKRSQVALEVSAVLHHHCVSDCVTPTDENKMRQTSVKSTTSRMNCSNLFLPSLLCCLFIQYSPCTAYLSNAYSNVHPVLMPHSSRRDKH